MLPITRKDIEDKLDNKDILKDLSKNEKEKKQKELAALESLAESIKKYSVRNPIEIYRDKNQVYRLVHGERRCLASLLAKKDHIPARVLDEKPSEFDLRILQLIENVQREDLSASETIEGMEKVIVAYQAGVKEPICVNAALIKKLFFCSRSQSYTLANILTGSDLVKKAIKSGQVQNLEKAAVIARVQKDHDKKTLLNYCEDENVTLKQLKIYAKEIASVSQSPKQSISNQKKKRGRAPEAIQLGKVTNPNIVRKLVEIVLASSEYKPFSHRLSHISYEDYQSCSDAFSILLNIMQEVDKP